MMKRAVSQKKYRHFIYLILTISFMISITSCAKKPAVYSKQFIGTFDTVITVTGHLDSQEEFDVISTYTETRFIELHRLFDIYNSYEGIQNIRTINDHAGISPVKVDPEIIRLILFSKEWYEKTSGKFNIAFGSVLKIWHDYRQMADPGDLFALVPSRTLLEDAAQHTSIENILVDEKANTVYISDPKTQIDVGAVAKGYATERVARELIQSGHTNFAINAGGNIRVCGAPIARGNEKWTIGIQNPKRIVQQDPNADLIGKVLVTDTAVVTSGWYQRYYVSGGIVYHHIIDPETLFPLNHYQAVSVIHPDAGICDVLSTALMLIPPDELSSFLLSFPEAEAIWILENDELIKTEGMDQLLAEPLP
jgi:FAD:protein FMN transferase